MEYMVEKCIYIYIFIYILFAGSVNKIFSKSFRYFSIKTTAIIIIIIKILTIIIIIIIIIPYPSVTSKMNLSYDVVIGTFGHRYDVRGSNIINCDVLIHAKCVWHAWAFPFKIAESKFCGDAMGDLFWIMPFFSTCLIWCVNFISEISDTCQWHVTRSIYTGDTHVGIWLITMC